MPVPVVPVISAVPKPTSQGKRTYRDAFPGQEIRLDHAALSKRQKKNPSGDGTDKYDVHAICRRERRNRNAVMNALLSQYRQQHSSLQPVYSRSGSGSMHTFNPVRRSSIGTGLVQSTPAIASEAGVEIVSTSLGSATWPHPTRLRSGQRPIAISGSEDDDDDISFHRPHPKASKPNVDLTSRMKDTVSSDDNHLQERVLPASPPEEANKSPVYAFRQPRAPHAPSGAAATVSVSASDNITLIQDSNFPLPKSRNSTTALASCQPPDSLINGAVGLSRCSSLFTVNPPSYIPPSKTTRSGSDSESLPYVGWKFTATEQGGHGGGGNSYRLNSGDGRNYRSRQEQCHDGPPTGQPNPATIYHQHHHDHMLGGVGKKARIDRDVMDKMTENNNLDRAGGGLILAVHNDNDIYDNRSTIRDTGVHSKASKYTRDKDNDNIIEAFNTKTQKRVSTIMPIPPWLGNTLSQLAQPLSPKSNSRSRLNKKTRRPPYFLARMRHAEKKNASIQPLPLTRAIARRAGGGGGSSTPSCDRSRTLSEGVNGMDRVTLTPRLSAREQDEENIFAFAPPLSPPSPLFVSPNTTVIEDLLTEPSVDSNGRDYATSTPPFAFSQSSVAMKTGASVHSSYDEKSRLSDTSTTPTHSSLFCTSIAPIVMPERSPPRSSSLAPSSPLLDNTLHSLLDNNTLSKSLLTDESSTLINGTASSPTVADPFGATWIALKKEHNTLRNSGPSKSTQRRFFFQQPSYSRPDNNDINASTSACNWTPSFPDAKTPNHRNAPPPQKSQLRNNFLGSVDPLVTAAAIEEASRSAQAAAVAISDEPFLLSNILCVGPPPAHRPLGDISDDHLPCEPEQADISYHVRFRTPGTSFSYSLTENSDLFLLANEDIEGEQTTDLYEGMALNVEDGRVDLETLHASTNGEDDAMDETGEHIEVQTYEDGEADAIHEDHMQSDDSHDSIHSWSEVDAV